VWLNGKLTGETGLNAALCGHFDVPVVMVSGDQSVCAEANEWLHAPELAVVKKAHGRNTAECLPLELARQMIREASLRAISRFRADQANPPLKYSGPVQIGVEFLYTDMTDRAALVPGAQRIDGRKVQISGENMPAAYNAFRTLVQMASR
jgi:D-amino peptidase